MTPNAARLLHRYGIEKVVGDNLVRNKELHIRTKEGKQVGFVKIEGMEEASGGEWWLVHRYDSVNISNWLGKSNRFGKDTISIKVWSLLPETLGAALLPVQRLTRSTTKTLPNLW